MATTSTTTATFDSTCKKNWTPTNVLSSSNVSNVNTTNVYVQPSNPVLSPNQLIPSTNNTINHVNTFYNNNMKVLNNNNIYNNNTRFIVSPMIRFTSPLVPYSPLIPPPTITNNPSGKYKKIHDEQKTYNTFDGTNKNNREYNNLKLSKTNLYIKGLGPKVTDKDLVTMCQQYGKITSTKAIIDQDTGECKGFGFVDYESESAAQAAVKALQEKGMQVQMAKQQEQDQTNLYISSLPESFTETDLKNLFASQGGIISIRILKDQNDKSRGVGFVRMTSKESCEQAINALNGKVLSNQREALTVKFADGGSKKKFYNNNNINNNNNNNNNINNKWNESLVPASSQGIFEQISAVPTPGYAQLAPMPRYVASNNPPFYQAPQSWICPQGIIMQAPPIAPSQVHFIAPPTNQMMSPDLLPQMSAQMAAIQLAPSAYPGGYVHVTYPASNAAIEEGYEHSSNMTYPLQYK